MSATLKIAYAYILALIPKQKYEANPQVSIKNTFGRYYPAWTYFNKTNAPILDDHYLPHPNAC